jgi:hypothetical protein
VRRRDVRRRDVRRRDVRRRDVRRRDVRKGWRCSILTKNMGKNQFTARSDAEELNAEALYSFTTLSQHFQLLNRPLEHLH